MKGRAIYILAGVLVLSVCGSSFGKYSGGTGEPNKPYIISTAADMNEIGTHTEDWGSSFLLAEDINLSDFSGTQFNVIGTDYDNPFLSHWLQAGDYRPRTDIAVGGGDGIVNFRDFIVLAENWTGDLQPRRSDFFEGGQADAFYYAVELIERVEIDNYLSSLSVFSCLY